MYWADNTRGVILVLLCSSVTALAYNIIHSMVIHRTSAVTTTVIGQIKIVALIVLSAVLLGESK